MMSATHRALLALLIVTLIWGWTFSWMKTAMTAAESIIPGHGAIVIAVFMALRFGMAAVLMPLCVRQAREAVTQRSIWMDGGQLATVLMAGFLLQMFGLQGIDPAVSAFLTSLYVAFTALLTRVIDKVPLTVASVIGVAVVTTGAAFISGPPSLQFDLPEWLTVLCAFVFAVHILVTDRVAKRSPPLAVTWTSFVWVTGMSSGLLLFLMNTQNSPKWEDIMDLVLLQDFLWPTVCAGLLGTLLAISLMTNFQKSLSPIRAAIIYALEPVWAAIIAVSIGQTQIDGWLIFGGASLLLGNLWMELSPRIWPKQAPNVPPAPSDR